MKFQEEVTEELLLNIIYYFHPELLSNKEYNHSLLHNKSHGEYTRKPFGSWHSLIYSWVSIEVRVKGYGLVSLSINNHDAKKAMWGKINKDIVSDLFRNNQIGYRIWRCSLDKLYKKTELQSDEVKFKDQIPLPSQKEYLDYYMSE